MDDVKGKINAVLIKFSLNKWDILNAFDVSSIDGLVARFGWEDIIAAILRGDSYRTSAVKALYTDILGREADPDGLRSHAAGYAGAGWRNCLAGFLGSDEFWVNKGGASPRSFLAAVWRLIADDGDLPDLDDLASSLSSGLLSRDQAVRSLVSRPEIARRESDRLWRRLTGTAEPAPQTIVGIFERGGREETIRTICGLPDFAFFASRNGEVKERPVIAPDSKAVASNPYKDRPPHTYWKYGVAESGAGTDPVVGAPFRISRSDRIATAGSCFAQHLSKALAAWGYHYLVTESYQPQTGVSDENYGIYPARFGNIYTARQLLQLFERAYGLRASTTEYWHGEEGRVIDPFRPRIQEGGYPDIESLLADRERHYRAVRQMFEQCRVFIFTLGLTETWMSPADGSVYPLAPGVVASRLPDDNPHFHNFSVGEVSADLERFLTLFFEINPTANVILTVSPVPLIATFEDRHVLVSTIASKSILRAAVDEVCRRHAAVTYFPSYEIIAGPQTAAKFYREDLREVSEDGVTFVMSVFGRHFLSSDAVAAEPSATAGAGKEDVPGAELKEEDFLKYTTFSRIVCDEEFIVK